MRSVVVEASTVAKAIEIAWLKAEKPEEFFIRVLQEHSAGFLGFGAQKAKIVFFFKNSHKSDSLFPILVKQKEYANFFDNQNLKVPTTLNTIDSELNKNVSLGFQQKKKHHNQLPFVKNNQQNKNQNVDKKNQQNHDARKYQQHGKPHSEQNVHKVEHKQQVAVNNGHIEKNEQNKIRSDFKQEIEQKSKEHTQSKMQISLEMSQTKKSFSDIEKRSFDKSVTKDSVEMIDKIDDAVKNIAQVLKKVQSKKIIANVSRPSLHEKSKAPKFESYEKFVQATEEAAKEKLEKKQVLEQEKVVLTAAPQRPVLKMKRRLLSIDNVGVSGITPSKPKVVPVQNEQTQNFDKDKNNTEDKD